MGVVLHVGDVRTASRFYESIGFVETGAYPRADGELALAILNYGPSTLLLGRRDELNCENTARARRIRRGPHGLGVVITLLVPDLSRVYRTVRASGLEVLLEPLDEFTAIAFRTTRRRRRRCLIRYTPLVRAWKGH